MTLCACGCGKEITIKNKYKFIRNHKHRNYHNSDIHKKKCSIALKNKPGLCGEKNGMFEKTGNKHPMFGKSKSKETKIKMSAAQQGTKSHNYGKTGKLCTWRFGKTPSHLVGRGERSYYQSPLQGQVCFRSSYELVFAKYLDSIHELWMYEMETFDLGNTTYTPDFFLPRQEKFVEIKGYMLPKAQEKINQFRKQYPWDLDVLQLKELKSLGAK